MSPDEEALMPCACGRPFVPEVAMYHGHVQTPEHQRWRMEVELGRPLSVRERVKMVSPGLASKARQRVVRRVG